MKKGILLIACGFVLFAGPCVAGTDDDPEQYLEDRETMREMVADTGISEEDQLKIVKHVVDEEGRPTSDSLRDSGISDETWEQLTDDARFE